jgi:uncharacterized membrane protein
MGEVDLKAVGPMQLLAVAFQKPNFKGRISDELKKLRDNKFIRIVDGIAVQKDAAGKMTVREESDLTPEQNKLYGAIIGGLIGIGAGDTKTAVKMSDRVAEKFNRRYEYGLDKEDLDSMAEEIPNGDAALILLIEHVWAIPLRNALRSAGGMLMAQDFLSPELLISIGRQQSAALAA